MINDRVNCMRYMFTSWRGTYALQIDYSLEYAKVLLRKTFYHLWQGGGLCKGVTACVEKKNFKYGCKWVLQALGRPPKSATLIAVIIAMPPL